MSIIDIVPISSLPKVGEKQTKIMPVYLVITEDPGIKAKCSKILAVRMDETSPTTVKFVGIDLDVNADINSENYQEIINSTDKKLYKEIMLPWQRVIRIQNLIFRQKQ